MSKTKLTNTINNNLSRNESAAGNLMNESGVTTRVPANITVNGGGLFNK